ncbi:hypothetical protein EVAR_68235_1 [Eumeta japonica]|uniref:Uncharacterized protein n=1 Tax=Eumeta variegata TaxID=151549 RepID=A0A4C1ZR49_EUMVA|nr:hypothetical protein EVAR_68235_1 [Eumeta japonica]
MLTQTRAHTHAHAREMTDNKIHLWFLAQIILPYLEGTVYVLAPGGRDRARVATGTGQIAHRSVHYGRCCVIWNLKLR